jgi:hypothetical protein
VLLLIAYSSIKQLPPDKPDRWHRKKHVHRVTIKRPRTRSTATHTVDEAPSDPDYNPEPTLNNSSQSCSIPNEIDRINPDDMLVSIRNQSDA